MRVVGEWSDHDTDSAMRHFARTGQVKAFSTLISELETEIEHGFATRCDPADLMRAHAWVLKFQEWEVNGTVQEPKKRKRSGLIKASELVALSKDSVSAQVKAATR